MEEWKIVRIFAANYIDMSSNVMIKTISDYFKTQPVLKAWLFGSYARGEENADSDIDILVTFDNYLQSLRDGLEGITRPSRRLMKCKNITMRCVSLLMYYMEVFLLNSTAPRHRNMEPRLIQTTKSELPCPLSISIMIDVTYMSTEAV